MSDRLVRLALLLYPAAWRRRYGAELEQLVYDSVEHDPSLRASARLILDVARGGLSQRIGHRRRALRALALVSLGVGVVFPIDVATIGTPAQMGLAQVLPSPLVKLAPSATLAPGVSVFRFPASMLPLLRSAQPPSVELEVSAHSDRVFSVDGPPARVVVNPQTGQLLSATPIGPLTTP